MTAAGKRDDLIRFERSADVRSDLGTKQRKSWTEIGNGRWARTFYGTGAERRQGGANQKETERAVQVATFNVHSDSLTRSILITDRIAFDGLHWDINGIIPLGRGEIEFTATASRG